MPKMSDHEEYLDSIMVENGDKVVLLDEGTFRDPEETGLSRTVFQIRIRLPDERTKIWTMNKTTRKRLAKAYGDDSAGWINRSVRLEILSQNVMGETKNVLYGHPVEGGPTPQQGKIDSPASKANKIIEFIANSCDDYSLEDVKASIKDERAKAMGLLTEEAAAYLLCQTLGLDIEASGVRIA